MSDNSLGAPLYFPGSVDPLFGWYHAPSGSVVRSCGIVLCSPIGHEETHAHRAFRHLAERLAAAGFPTLRFDHHGTGDSGGEDGHPDRLCIWRHDIAAGVATLQRQSGVNEIGIIGLRVGALLAAAYASERASVSTLVLLDPCSGAAYLREMRFLDQLARRKEPVSVAEPLGFVLNAATVADLEQLCLERLKRRPAARMLILRTRAAADETEAAAHLRALGVGLTENRHNVRWPFDQPTLPHDILDACVSWLSEQHAAVYSPTAKETRASTNVLLDPHFQETHFRFGSNGRLFGVLTSPTCSLVDRSDTGVIILNAGLVRHVGPHRMHVKMARRWAAQGSPCLRFDLSGIGDSRPGPDEPENEFFPGSAIDDVKAAMSEMQTRGGVGRFELIGLCSGAAVAFAVALDDSRVGALTLLNIAEFYFDARAKQTFGRADFDFHERRAELFSLRNTMSDWGPLRRASVLRAKLASVTRRLGARITSESPVDASRDMDHLLRRGVDILLLLGDSDSVGLQSLALHLGSHLEKLTVPGAELRILRGMDHILLPLAKERQAIELIAARLAKRKRAVDSTSPT